MSEMAEISFVIPCHNEAANLKPLVAAIGAAVEPLKRITKSSSRMIAARMIRGRW